MTHHVFGRTLSVPYVNIGWTPELEARLEQLWMGGQSASEIARELGTGHTRNSVIGKVHRMDLHKKYPRLQKIVGHKNRIKLHKVKPGGKVVIKTKPAPIPKADAPPAKVDAFAALPGSTPVPFGDATGCLWPVGDLFCNAEIDGKRNHRYCAHHRGTSSLHLLRSAA